MANYDGRTVSNGISIKDKIDKDAIERYCGNFYFAMEDLEPMFEKTKDGWVFGIWGYDHLSILKYTENEDNDERYTDYEYESCNDEFFEGLQHLIPKGEQLIVQGIGCEKLKYVGAWEVSVSRDKIEYGGFKFAWI